MMLLRIFLVLSLFQVVLGCGLTQSLRREAYDDEGGAKEAAQRNGLRDPVNHRLIPPPATVLDRELTSIQGSPVDLSGVRAKAGRITRNDFDALAARNENSLWKEDGQNNYYFSSNKQRMPGDLVSVEIEEDLKRDLLKEYKKTISVDERAGLVIPGITKEKSSAAATSAVDKAAATAGASGAAADSAATQAGAAATAAAGAATAGAASAAAEVDENAVSTATTFMTAEVVQKYPNGNVLLRGIKRIPYRNQVRTMEVTAIVKGSDIAENETVKSSKFFESKVEAYR